MADANNGSFFQPPRMDDEDRKLFLGGLPWEATEQDLQDYFGQFGVVSNVSIKVNPQTGNPRGFGFITFESEQSIDAVLNSGPHSIKNKVIDPRKAKSKQNEAQKKIFVGGIPAELSEDEIRSYFSQYGRVETCEMPFDKVRNRRREFCFIIFEGKDSADAAVLNPKQQIGGRECDIKRAQPNSNQNGRLQRGMNGMSGGQGGYGQQMSFHQPTSYGYGSNDGTGNWGGYGGQQMNGQEYGNGGWNNGGHMNGGRGGGGRGGPRNNGMSNQFRSRQVYSSNGHQGGQDNFAPY